MGIGTSRISEKTLLTNRHHVVNLEKTEINTKCNARLPENGRFVQVGVIFLMSAYPSSFFPKRSPSHLGGPGSGKYPVLTLCISSELINYSGNLRPGMSEFFLFDCYAKIFWSVTPIPNFRPIGPVFWEI